MKINLDRLCKLAGVQAEESNILSEASNSSLRDDPGLEGEAEYRFGKDQLAEAHHDMEEGMYEEDMEEGMHSDMHEDMEEGMYEEDMEEMIEVDEAMLVQEIRRAKKLMAESRQRKTASRESLQEAQLRKMISEEIEEVFKDLNLTSGWVYGNKKPTNRHRGAVNTAFPGIGFRKNK